MKRTFNFPENAKGNNAVEVSAFYSKGGFNYFHGGRDESGFYISFQPGKKQDGQWGSCFMFEVFGDGGFKIRVADGSRDNKKKCAKLLELVTEEMARDAFEGNKQRVFESLKNTQQ